MNKIIKNDPFGILASAAEVAQKAEFVFINENKINAVADAVYKKIKSGLENAESSFWSLGNFENDIQLVFFEDTVNFSFWSDAGTPQWRIAYPDGAAPGGGWYSLVACFRRAIEMGIPVLDSGFAAKITLAQCRKIFVGDGNINIPLLEDRQKNLNEAGTILLKNFNGRFLSLLEQADFDAVKITKLIYDRFPSFRDEAVYKNKKIMFLKRAQICASDIAGIFEEYGKTPIKNLDALTAFADYKLPQILRKYGLIEYKNGLAQKIDRLIPIDPGSQEEIEIRAATIFCVETIRRQLEIYSAPQIDNALWLMSQGQTGAKPFHRCRTIFY